MFTGIIEEVGVLKGIEQLNRGLKLNISASIVIENTKLGDSIAINGACQTVTNLGKSFFEVEVSQETINVTNFKDLKLGSHLNLERAMPANGRFDGHIVSGHVDSVGKFIQKINDGISDIYTFSAPDEVLKYIVYKGSICINGISLTICKLVNEEFSVAVIPHTTAHTTLQYLKVGDMVNLESDILAKYIEKFVTKSDNTGTGIKLSYLQEHGFA